MKKLLNFSVGQNHLSLKWVAAYLFLGLTVMSFGYIIPNMQKASPISFVIVEDSDIESSNKLTSASISMAPETISGVIFRDFQNDGIVGIDDQRWDVDELPSQLVITAYASDNTVAGMTNPDVAGNWTMDVELPVRLEITNLLEGYVETKVGPGHISSIAFISTAGSSYNFGICYLYDITQVNPRLITGCLSRGAWSSGSSEPLVASWNYNTRVPSSATKRAGNMPHTIGSTPHTIDALYGNIGHVWGVESHWKSQSVFLSAMASPYWGVGPLGIDGIYKIDYSGPGNTATGVSNFLDLTTLGIDVTGDGTAFGQQGLGGMACSEDEENLYIVNVGKKELIVLNIGQDGVAPGIASVIPIADPGCIGGNWRPFAIEERRNKLYVGGICDASTSTETNLYTYVLEYDLDQPTNGWNVVLERVMDWEVGALLQPVQNWKKWSGTFNDSNRQPILVGLGFDIDGSMVLGYHVRARFHDDDQDHTGAMVRAHKDGTGFTMEFNGISGPYTTMAHNTSGNARGTGGIPTNRNFFFSNTFLDHGNTASGGVAVVPGTGQVLTGQADPTAIFTFGLVYHNAFNGQGDFGHIIGSEKAAFVTDIGVISDESTPIVGNYVWQDDGDGIQEAGEDPISGMIVKLYSKPTNGDDPVLAATTTSNASGEYYFSNTTVADETWVNGFTNVEKDSSYYIVFMGDNYDEVTNLLSLNGNKYFLTDNDAATGVNEDNIDSDVTEINIPAIGILPAICITPTETNFSFDAGFIPKPDLALLQVLDPGFDFSDLKFGDSVKFKITVFNQSAGSIDSLEITNYIPDGYSFDSSIAGNANWETDINGNPVTVISNSLEGNGKDSVCIYLTLKPTLDPQEWINVAEISNAWSNGDEIEDCDSPLNNNPDDNVGSLIDTPADDYINGDGTATGLDGVANTDQDNVDPATVPICDLALINIIDELPTSLTVGDTVKYAVIVENQGNVPATNIKIYYTIPDGFDYVVSNDVLTPAWTEGVNSATVTITETLGIGEKDTICIYLIVENVSTNDVTEDSWTTIAEISAFQDPSEPGIDKSDVDSTPDSITDNDSGGNPDDDTNDVTSGDGSGDPMNPIEDSNPALDEDDHDPAIIYVCDAAIIVYAEIIDNIEYGDTVKFNVVVFNQGNGDITNIELNDFLGSGLEFISTSVNDAEGWTGNSEQVSITIDELLNPGQSDTVCLELIVKDVLPFDEDAYLQIVEIAHFEDPDSPGIPKFDIDSKPDEDPNNDSGGNPEDSTDNETDGEGTGDPENPMEDSDPSLDEDDNDPELLRVFDLALDKKIIDDITYAPGEKPVLEITVYNQGNVYVDNYKLTDYLRGGFSFSTMGNPGWTMVADDLLYTSSGGIAPGDSVVILLELTVQIPAMPTGVSDWWNYVEISDADNNTNPSDADPVDADSTPDNNDMNDNPVEPGDDNDDVVVENGKFGDDEDDHDPVAVTVGYDLALRKTVSPTGPYSYGDTLTYTIEIFNQGGLAVSNVDIYDVVPCGLLFIEDGNDWDYAANIATTTIEEVIIPGSSATTELLLVVQRCDQPGYNNYFNVAEISDFLDDAGGEPLTEDLDSTPDNIVDNDGDVSDNEINESAPAGGDEDDHDIEDIIICDLALINTLVEIPLVVSVYDTIKYDVIVFNQGNVDANSASIDYTIPNGLTYLPVNSSLTPMWLEESETLASITTDKVLAPGESDTICIYLRLEHLSTDEVTPDSWTTIAEITGYTDENDNPKSIDADSSPDDNPGNDSGGNPSDDTDDEIDGNGNGDPENPVEDSDPALDEDDNDAAIVYVCDVAAIIYSDLPVEINYYDTLKFNVVLSNQGNGAITNILVADHIPDGFELVATPSNTVEGWVENDDIGNAISFIYDEILEPGESDTICLELKIIPVDGTNTSNSWLQVVEVVSFEDPANPGVSKSDIDSTPDSDPANDSGGNPEDDTDDEVDGDGTGDPNDPMDDTNPDLDEDDNDPVDTKVLDLALIMQIDSMPPVLPVIPGDILKFIVVVTNQGNTPVNDIEITNYLMDDNLELAAVVGNAGWNAVDSESNEYTIDEALLPGEKDTVCIYLEVIGGAMSDIITYSEISGSTETDGVCYDIDSTPDNENSDVGGTSLSPEDDHIFDDGEDGNNDGITDEDDHDPAMLDVQDLALIIWADQKAPVVEGQDVKFIIRVINQGNILNENIKIVNYIPEGFEYSSSDTYGWEVDAMDSKKVTKVLAESLDMGETIETCIILKVLNGVSAEDLINYAEIVSSNDADGLDLNLRDVDSTPNDDNTDDTGGQYEDMPDCNTDPVVINDDNNVSGAGVIGEDEDDHDPAWVHVFDLASITYTDQTTPVIPGDEVKFNVELINQGNMSATDVSFIVQMPSGFVLSEDDDNGWVEVDGNLEVTYGENLIPGQKDTICLLLKVLPDHMLEDLIPIVEIVSAFDTLGNDQTEFDLDSKPNTMPEDDEGGEIFTESDDKTDGNGEAGDDEDDHDPAVPPVMDLAIKIVTVDDSPMQAGDLVKFSIMVYNQGSMIPSEFTIENYVPEGLVFMSIPGNAGWLPSGPNNATFTYTEDLLPLTSDTICIYLLMDDDATPLNVVNMVEISEIIDQFDNDVSLLDLDSESDNSNENDLGNDLYSAEDNKIDENGRSGFDEDDHDQAYVLMCLGMACKGQVNFSIDESCEGSLTPSMLLTGDIFPDHIYTIVVKNENNIIVPNLFGVGDIGKTFEVSIINPLCDNNSCWLPVTVEYKFDPVIDCVENDTLSCMQAFSEASIPSVSSNCVPSELIKIQENIENLSCDSMFTAKMTRAWVAKDAYGNISDTCTQEVFLLRTNLDSITPVMNFMLATNNAISCSSGYATDAKGHPAPSVTGVPRLKLQNGSFIDMYPFTAQVICNGFVEYNDEVLAGSTNCVTKILRTWTIGEWWCSQTNERKFVQLIEVVDFQGPTISCPADITISTSSQTCEGFAVVKLPEVTDACNDDNITFDLGTPAGFYPDYKGEMIMLPVGVHSLIYTVYDDCGNNNQCTFNVTVRDLDDPIAICDQFTTVAIGLDNLTFVSAGDIDDGSFDECGDISLEIARMDEPGFLDLSGFGPKVSITCSDVGTEVMVGLLVTDGGGNTNMCMVTIEVQDKIDAKMSCPADTIVECNFAFDPDKLDDFFGKPMIYDNCPDANTYVDKLVGELNQCGAGVLIREITLLNVLGQQVDFCTQQITFEKGDVLEYSDIIPPPSEVTVTGCGIGAIDPTILGMPIIPDDYCQLASMNVINDTFPFTQNGACLKILRTFNVVDWCIEDGPGSVLQPFVFNQTIKVHNLISPEIENVFADSVFCTYAIGCGPVTINGYLTATASDDCTAVDDLLNRFEVRTVGGSLVKFGFGLDASGTYDIGEYEVRFISEDKCGNQSFEESTFEVRSCKLPTPYCLQGLSTTLIPMDTTGDGTADIEMVMLNVSFFDAGSYHPCGYDVQLSFSEDLSDTIATYFCSDTVGLQPVELWVTDQFGNSDYCTTFVDIQDNDTIDLCGSMRPVDIQGRIYTEMDAAMKGAEVALKSAESLTTSSNENGEYGFWQMATGGDYKIEPRKDNDHLNGVSTLDLVLIQRHILGIEPLNSVYKRIAADINNNEKISASDLLALRKVILGIEMSFPNNTSWRFIDEGFVFTNENDPWEAPFSESYDISNLSQDMWIDFIAVKTGDVNGNVDMNIAAGAMIETRNSETLTMNFPDLDLKNGRVYQVDVLANESANVFGMQYSLDLEGVEVLDILPGRMDMQRNFTAERNDMIFVSYASASGDVIRKGDVLYSFVIRANRDGQLSEMLSMSAHGLNAESYLGESLSTGNVDINWRGEDGIAVQEKFVLVGNRPNPWRSATEIEFFMPKKGKVNLILTDVSGRLLMSRETEFEMGPQLFKVNNEDVQMTGVMMYELRFDDQIVNGRMIRIK